MPSLNLPDGPREGALLVFDKDGVLADFHRAWGAMVRARVDALTRLSGLADLVEALKAGFGVDTAWRPLPQGLLATGSRTQAIAVAAACLEAVGVPEARAIAETAFAQADAAVSMADRHAALPGAGDTLRHLAQSGWRLAIASTDTTSGIREFLAHNRLDGLAIACVGSDRVARGKPAPEMFRLACGESGVGPHAAAMIGDGLVDLQMGRAAGAFATIGVLGGVGTHEMLAPHADWLVPDVTALVPPSV
ncbi:MAG TPA: HAD family hydrolase [Oscillatoriaceae cyanobacterium]